MIDKTRDSVQGHHYARRLLEELGPEGPDARHHSPATLLELPDGRAIPPKEERVGDDRYKAFGVTLTARRCYNGWHRDEHGCHARIRWTGGCVIQARCRPVALRHRSYGNRSIEAIRRLKPGWTEEQFIRAASHCYHEVRQVLHEQETDPIHRRREALYDRFEAPGRLTNDLLEAIDAAYQEHGHSEDYQAMTEEDIRFWNDFLDRWEKEHPLEPREEGGGGEIPESTLKTNVN